MISISLIKRKWIFKIIEYRQTGLSWKKIGSIFGISENAAYKRSKRFREKKAGVIH